ncbi:MAG: hypothetical protein AB1921_02400 [Thermodesulfobacteriota bacterium]
MRKIVCLLCCAIFLLPATAFCAKDFFDAIKFGVSGGTVKNVNAKLYNSITKGAFNDPNLDGNLDPGETMIGTVKIYNRSGKLALESPPNLNRDQLEAWAVLNADRILNTIFEGDLSQATGQSSDAVIAQKNFSEQILEKVNPTVNEFKGALEYENLDVLGETANAYSALFGYNWGFDSGATLGLMLPYRYTQMDDGPSSKSHFGGLNLYFKYPVKKWDKVTWNLGADAFGSVYMLTSDAVDLLGNLKYGGGAFTSLSLDLSSVLISAGCEYMLSDANVPGSLVDTDDPFIDKAVGYVNNLSTVQTVSYGLNIGVPLAGGKAAVNLEAVRSQFISDDIPDDRKEQTTALVSVAYRPTETFELNLGAHTVLELTDIDVWGLTLGTVFRF